MGLKVKTVDREAGHRKTKIRRWARETASHPAGLRPQRDDMRPETPLLLLGALAALSFTAMADTSPAKHRLDTPWTADALSGKGWLEYPRPQLERSRWLNLNGIWECAVTGRAAPAPASFPDRIRVPYPVESALSGLGRALRPDETLWYRRSVDLPAAWKGERILLHFGAVNWNCAVWVNGGLAGTHQGGYDPFTLDITAWARAGSAQQIVVSVDNPANTSDQARGKQHIEPNSIWYTPASGIWQTVWLEPVPAEASIAEIRTVPDVDAGVVELSVLAEDPVGLDTYAFRARVLDGESVVAEVVRHLDRTVRVPIPKAKLWSPEHPHLYGLEVQLFRIPDPIQGKRIPHRDRREAELFKVGPDAVPVDSVRSYFGMRKISMAKGPKGPVFALNNRPLFIFGTLDQGFWPDGIYTPPTEAAFRHDLDFLKQAGFNSLRKHVKVEPELFYAYCDRIGLLVWQDMPSAMEDHVTVTGPHHQPLAQWVAPDVGEMLRRSSTAAQFELELRRMVDALSHHPSIVIWVPFNEGWGQYDTNRVAAGLKAYDPTRLVDASSGWKDTGGGDIRDYHTYAPDPSLEVPADPGRITVVGEFGGVALKVDGHLWQASGWGYQESKTHADLAREYKHRVDGIAGLIPAHAVAGAIYTQTTDVEGELNGLLTYDRRVTKIPVADLRLINAALGPDKL
jgi:beta-galactosidase/beta-glucuronidase